VAALNRFKTVDGVRIEEYRDGKSSHVYVDGHLYPGRYEHAIAHYEKKEKQDAPPNKS